MALMGLHGGVEIKVILHQVNSGHERREADMLFKLERRGSHMGQVCLAVADLIHIKVIRSYQVKLFEIFNWGTVCAWHIPTLRMESRRKSCEGRTTSNQTT